MHYVSEEYIPFFGLHSGTGQILIGKLNSMVFMQCSFI